MRAKWRYKEAASLDTLRRTRSKLLRNHGTHRTDKGSVIFYLEGAPESLAGQLLFLRSKGGIKRFFQIEKGDHLYFLKETKYFAKHFRFKRKGLLDATRG